MRGRRVLLQAAAAGAGGWLLGVAGTSATEQPAYAASSNSKIRRVQRGQRGVTLTLALDHAPFPKGAKKYGDPTVLVYVPDYYRLPKRRKVDMIVHFHGHNTLAITAVAGNQLREQLHDSKQNAILVAPQGPVRAIDSSAGQLEKRGGFQRLVMEIVRVLRSSKASKALKKSSLAGVKDVDMVCLSAHSGGYRAVASCLDRGRVNVNEVYLFDALYGEVGSFRRWVVARKHKKGRARHKLVCHYAGGKVRENSLALMKKLKSAGVKVLHETKPGQLTRSQLVKGSAIFVATPLAHGSVAFQHNNLRDCLFASGLKRHVKSDWFKEKNAPRKIDARGG